MAARRDSRFLTLLIVAIASLALAGSFASVAYADLVATQIEDDTPITTQADYGARITSPSNGTVYEVDKTVTVKVTAKYHKVGNATWNPKPNYIYLKITRDGIRQNYLSQTITSTLAIEQDRTASFSFRPTTEGEYLIEACQDWNYDDDNHIDLAYEGFTKDSSISITAQKDISKAETVVSGLVDKTYTGQALTQEPVVTVDGKTLDSDTDYDVSCNDVNVGQATVTITGKGLYKGTTTATFNITPADISKATVTGVAAKNYSKGEVTQTPSVRYGGVLLEEGEDKDYVLSYENNVNAGTATMTVEGRGNYSGSLSKSFTINKVSICSIGAPSLRNATYTGSQITQDLDLWFGGRLVEGVDYTATYTNNINPGTATVKITGINNFKDSRTKTFSILEQSSSGVGGQITAPNNNVQLAVGSTITIKAKAGVYNNSVVWVGTSGPYTVADWNYIYIRIRKLNERTGEYETVKYIDEKNPLRYTSANREVSTTYTASSKGTYQIQMCRQALTIGADNHAQFIKESDFSPSDSITVYVGVSAPGAKQPIDGAQVTGVANKQYTGNSITQSPTIKLNGKTLKKGTDYYLTYQSKTYSSSAGYASNNIDVGKVEMTVHGKGSYTGTISKTFEIVQKPITADMITLTPSSMPYTGEQQRPQVTVMHGFFKLSETVAYDVGTDGGTVPGTYSVTVTARERQNYSGSATKTFTITKRSINQAVVTVDPATYTYDGTAKEPAVTAFLDGVELPPDAYTVSYRNNTNAGTATATISAKPGSYYQGSASTAFTISPCSINQSSITVAPLSNVTFNRQAQTPKPQFTWGETTLNNPTDYTLSYENNRDAGTARVTIQGVGNFKGSRTLTFAINQKDINDGSIAVEPVKHQLYDEGTPSTPEIIVKDGGTKLTSDEFAVEYANNDAIGTATATITGIGNYTGTRAAIEFQILDAQTYATTELTDAIGVIEGAGIGGYLEDDRKALQAAIDAAKELLASGNATVEDLEQALASIQSIEGTAKANKAAYEKAKKAALAMPSAAEVSKQILSQKTDKDPSGSEFVSLKLKCVKQSKTYNVLTWNRVSGASRYVVYGSQCGKSNKIKKIATIKGNTYKHKKLKKGTYYKYVVVAIKDTVIGERVAATSKMIHVATRGGTVGNTKKVTIKVKSGKTAKAVKAVTIKKGKTRTLAATSTPVSSKLTVKKHVGLRYATTNSKVAKVSAKGVIKGVGKGTCYVFVYAQNGVTAKIKVTIK